MTFRTVSSLMPAPNSILAQLDELQHKYLGQRVMVAPHCEWVANLYLRGHFDGFDFVGAIDQNIQKHGRTLYGIPVHSVEAALQLDVAAVIVIHPQYHQAITTKLKETLIADIEVIDVCLKYQPRQFRQQLAEYFAMDNAEILRPCFANNPSDFLALTQVEVTLEAFWGLGDRLCALVAAREFAQRHPHLDVKFNDLNTIADAYGDELLSRGRAWPLPDNTNGFHRTKLSSPAANYLGCFYLGLGMDFDELPKLTLPEVALLTGLTSGQYIALQPTANFAKPNITADDLQKIIDACPLPVILTGPIQPINSRIGSAKDDMPTLLHASSEYYGDEMDMLKIIRHAALVVTPRSASAHIAAAYQVPTIAWVPNDGENWHLDYPDWDCQQVPVSNESAASDIIARIQQYFHSVSNLNTLTR